MTIYRKPPIKEAVCEFRFDIETPLSLDQISSLKQSLIHLFPEHLEGKNVSLNLDLKSSQEDKEIQKTIETFERLVNKEGNSSVHITREGVVSVHQLEPYKAWTDFYPLIQSVFHSYKEIVKPKGLLRAGLRYINQINLPKENFSPKKYFSYDLNLPFDDRIISQQLRLVFVTKSGRVAVQFIDISPNQDDLRFILDIDCFTEPDTGLNVNDAMSWLETSHEVVEFYFESLLTPETKSLFN